MNIYNILLLTSCLALFGCYGDNNSIDVRVTIGKTSEVEVEVDVMKNEENITKGNN